jgi:hypothetical protein
MVYYDAVVASKIDEPSVSREWSDMAAFQPRDNE